MTLVCGKNMWQGVNMPPAALLVRIEDYDSRQQTNQMFGRVYREHRLKDECLILDLSTSSVESFKEFASVEDSEFSVVKAEEIICSAVTREERRVLASLK